MAGCYVQIQLDLSIPVITLFFNLLFTRFLNLVRCLWTTVALYFLRFTLLPLCFGSLMTSYDLLHDYILLLLSFTYSSFTLFHLRNTNFVSFFKVSDTFYYYSMLLRLRLKPSLRSSFLWLGCRDSLEVLDGASQNQIGLIQSYRRHGHLHPNHLLHHPQPLKCVLSKSCPRADDCSSHSLGADPYLPRGLIESFLRVFKHFALKIPRGKVWVFLKKPWG